LFDQRPGQGDPLLLTARQLVPTMPCPRRETNPFKYLPRPSIDLTAFLSQHVKRKGNVFSCGECWHQAGRLKYKSHFPAHERAATSGIHRGKVSAQHDDSPFILWQESAENGEQGSFARSGPSQNKDEVASRDL
jgi:hypothetical protein